MLTEKDLKGLPLKEGKYLKSFGEGLFVEVRPQGYKYFIWKYRYPPSAKNRIPYQIGPHGKGFGKFTLKQARDEVNRLKVALKQGKDPKALKSKGKEVFKAPLWKEVAAQYLAWKEKTAKPSSMPDNRRKVNQINQKFGDRLITTITRPEGLAFKESIRAPVQSENVYRVCRQIFDYYSDRIDETNRVINPFRSSRTTKAPHIAKSHPFITDWKKVPQFLEDLSANKCNGDVLTNACAKFHLLTLVRAGEGVAAEWKEFDWDKRLWTIPAHKMKGTRQRQARQVAHLVPLSSAALSLLEKIKLETGNCQYLFDAPRGKKLPHITTDAVNNHLKHLGYNKEQTTLGFRNFATTHGIEILKVPLEVIDRQLAHKQKNKIIAAYDKSTLIDERTLFMERWGNLLLENGLII